MVLGFDYLKKNSSPENDFFRLCFNGELLSYCATEEKSKKETSVLSFLYREAIFVLIFISVFQVLMRIDYV